jgi:hypothetical protein
MYGARNPLVIEDLQFALDVLQESPHLGLDSEYRAKLQAVILKQIERRKGTIKRLPQTAEAFEPALEEVGA